MAPPQVVTFPEETLQRLYKNLEDKEDWDNICEQCTLPTMLHTCLGIELFLKLYHHFLY